MRKYLLLLLVPFLFLTDVKADTNFTLNSKASHEELIENYSTAINKAYSLVSEYNYNYYVIILPFNYLYSGSLQLILFDSISNLQSSISADENDGFYITIQLFRDREISIGLDGNIIANDKYSDSNIYTNFFVFSNKDYLFYDTNYNFISDFDISFSDFYSSPITINQEKSFPLLKNLINYSSWSEYENNHLENYTEVNLDNYEYVLLSLKDYNQTKAFQTNLQVKGQIGITPIYNYGQTSKDSVTEVQVQDRCNITYEDYTSYPFYIIQNDLQNNAIYAVKECSAGSSFKFDNTIFDITYITSENKDNPTVTIAGKTYNVIPYKDLPSTATKNEENNYIPGESENAITGESVGLSAIIKNTQKKLSEIWNIFTYFMSFVNQIFSTLPEEIRTVLVASFTVGCVLGLIKILKA